MMKIKFLSRSISVKILLMVFLLQLVNGVSFGQIREEEEENKVDDISQWVDLFTGDFEHAIPLIDLPGFKKSFPFKLIYHSGKKRSTSTSWVGLGWTLSAGSINREVRGIPDEFLGDTLYATRTATPYITVGVGAGTQQSMLGAYLNSRSPEKNKIDLDFNIMRNNRGQLNYALGKNEAYQKTISLFQVPDISLQNKTRSGSDFLQAASHLSIHGLTGEFDLPTSVINRTTTHTFRMGNGWSGKYSFGYIQGYYNVQQLANNGQRAAYSSYGFLNSRHASADNLVEDVSVPWHYNDNLPLRVPLPDRYTVQDQSKTEFLDLKRNHVEVISSPTIMATSLGNGIGSDYSDSNNHLGVNHELQTGESYVGALRDSSSTHVVAAISSDLDEVDWSFSYRNEMSGWSKDHRKVVSNVYPHRLAISGDPENSTFIPALKGMHTTTTELPKVVPSTDFKARSIQVLFNRDILDGNYHEVLPEFKVSILNSQGEGFMFNRKDLPTHHIAGFSSINSEGERYTYGLPAYVHKQVTHEIHTSGSQQKIEMAKYPYTFLLTSIVGPDYIDVTGDGITEDDLGYWVKFTYQQVTCPISPHTWEEFSTNDGYTKETSGEKELWYMAKAETSSHYITFSIAPQDSKYGKSAEGSTARHPIYSLQQMKLYSRDHDDVPVKQITFDYAPMAIADGDSTLALKKVWVDYYNQQVKSNPPYEFTYHTHLLDEVIANDYNGEGKHNDPLGPILSDRGLGNLSSLKYPSGMHILIDYEADDYGFVQHQVAKEFFTLVPSDGNASSVEKDNTKVSFRLKKKITGPLDLQEEKAIIKSYLADHEKIFFTILVDIKSPRVDRNQHIQGWASIDFKKPMGLEKDPSGSYVNGYFHVEFKDEYHPFLTESWQAIEDDHTDWLNFPGEVVFTENEADQKNQIRQLAGSAGVIRNLYDDFYRYCDTKEIIAGIKISSSAILLNAPDQSKKGGGTRVKQLTIYDGWNYDEEGVYGYLLKYETFAGDKTISSGVATRENYECEVVSRAISQTGIHPAYLPHPSVGYERVSVYTLAAAAKAGFDLRHVLRSDGSSIFPLKGISYRSDEVMVYDYYTARTFPMLGLTSGKEAVTFTADNGTTQGLSYRDYQQVVSQGYTFIENDMHGKLKMKSNYQQNSSGELMAAPNSWIRFDYASDPFFLEQGQVSITSNDFLELEQGALRRRLSHLDDSNWKFTLGQHESMVYDMNEYSSVCWQLGYNSNQDNVSLSLLGSGVIPVFLNTVSYSAGKKSSVWRTAVVNKHIVKKGILERIHSQDQGIEQETNFDAFDQASGIPTLTKFISGKKTWFEKTFLAYTQFKGMGPASQNLGDIFSISEILPFEAKGSYSFSCTSLNDLFPGDEMVIYRIGEDEDSKALGLGTYMGIVEGLPLLSTDLPLLTSQNYQVKIVRSGYRNTLSLNSGFIKSLTEPRFDQIETKSTQTYLVPKK